jgi:hypothetical protein
MSNSYLERMQSSNDRFESAGFPSTRGLPARLRAVLDAVYALIQAAPPAWGITEEEIAGELPDVPRDLVAEALRRLTGDCVERTWDDCWILRSKSSDK